MEGETKVAVEKTESVPENADVTETKKKRGMGRVCPYPDIRGRRGARGGPLFPPSLPMRGMMRVPFLPPPPRYRFPLPPPPRGPMDFRSRPPPLGGRGMLPLPRGRFPPPRGVT